ncbi:MAG: MATE family efflux transporter, partial [Planctomycetota bacterium]|nr:MATE family efflux transporter [Planctomycetota bacterium]
GQAAVQLSAADDDRVHGVIAAARRVRLTGALVGVALVGGIAYLTGEPSAPWILLASLYPLTHALELSTLFLRNQIAWSRQVLARAIAAGLSLGCVVILRVSGTTDPAVYLCAVAAGSAIGNLLLHLVGRKHLPAPGGPPTAVRTLLIVALPMGAASICQQLYFWIDNLFVRAWNGEAWLGRYNLAVRVMSFGIMAGVYASLAALPWLTRQHMQGRLAAALVRLTQPVLAVAGLGAGLLWPYAADVLELIGGDPHFGLAEHALHWLLLATASVYLGAPLLGGVVATGASRAVLAISVCALVVNLVGNTWLVPTHGIEGAAIATFATEVMVAAGALVALARRGVVLRERLLGWSLGPAAFLVGYLLSTAVHG